MLLAVAVAAAVVVVVIAHVVIAAVAVAVVAADVAAFTATYAVVVVAAVGSKGFCELVYVTLQSVGLNMRANSHPTNWGPGDELRQLGK